MNNTVRNLLNNYQDLFDTIKVDEKIKAELADNANLLYEAFNDNHKDNFYHLLKNYFEYIRMFIHVSSLYKEQAKYTPGSENYGKIKIEARNEQAKMRKIEGENNLLMGALKQYVGENKLNGLAVNFRAVCKLFSNITVLTNTYVTNNKPLSQTKNPNEVDEDMVLKFKNQLDSWSKEELEQYINADTTNIDTNLNNATLAAMKKACQERLTNIKRQEQNLDNNKKDEVIKNLQEENSSLSEIVEKQKQTIKELENQNIKRDQKMQAVLDQLDEINVLLNEMKERTASARFKKAKKATKRKVVKVQDWFKEKKMDLSAWHREHKLLGRTGLLASISLAGLAGATMAFKYSIDWVGRVVKAMYSPLQKIGLDKGLKNIKNFFGDKINDLKNTDLKAYQSIFNNFVKSIPVVAAISGAKHGKYRGTKKTRSPWLNKAENSFINRMTNKIKNLGGNVKDKTMEIKDNVVNSYNERKDEKEQKKLAKELNTQYIDMEVVDTYLKEFENLPEDKFYELVSNLKEFRTMLENGERIPEGYDKDLNIGTLDQIIKTITFRRDVPLSKKEQFINTLDNCDTDQLDSILTDLLDKLGRSEMGAVIDWQASGYGVNSFAEAKVLYDTVRNKRKEMAVEGMKR